MKIGVVGAGYLGVVLANCFAEVVDKVLVCEVDERKLGVLKSGVLTMNEPGLVDKFERNLREFKLEFYGNLESVIDVDWLFLCLPSLNDEFGRVDLSYIDAVIDEFELIAAERFKSGLKLPNLVNKSTVPVGTVDLISQRLEKFGVKVCANPEFLKEGEAINDFVNPERVIIGGSDEKAVLGLRELYERLGVGREKILLMFARDAEFAKYAANCFLAMRVSFINEMADLAGKMAVDIDQVRLGIGMDKRIGLEFLKPGLGFGGSCLPKDTLAFWNESLRVGAELKLVKSTIEINENRRVELVNRLKQKYGDLYGKKVLIKGLSFKKGTDDLRNSIGVWLVFELDKNGCGIAVWDEEKTLLKFRELLALRKFESKIKFFQEMGQIEFSDFDEVIECW